MFGGLEPHTGSLGYIAGTTDFLFLTRLTDRGQKNGYEGRSNGGCNVKKRVNTHRS